MADNNVEFPSNFPVVDGSQAATISWLKWFTWLHNGVSSIYQSGVTANRPTSLLWIGRRFFDTTLGKPVYVKSVRPTVWVDGSGIVS